MTELFPYKDSDHREDWNRFVRESVNATFLLDRNYMDYHKDRFSDCSLILTNNNRIIGLFPANATKSDACIYSHQGLTYGGLIVCNGTTSSEVFKMLDAICAYYKNVGFKKLIYKEIPSIYHSYPSAADQYWLFRAQALLKSRSISSVVPLNTSLPFSNLRQRKIKKAACAGHIVKLNDSSLEAFWGLLTESLLKNHHTHPVHSLQEIIHLKNKFPLNIQFHSVADSNNAMLGGCVVYETKNVAHIQYIAANAKGKDSCALDLLFYELTDYYRQLNNFKYLDYGISTEDGGKVLNNGLLFQKEGFGARAICYDTYELNLQNLSEIFYT